MPPVLARPGCRASAGRATFGLTLTAWNTYGVRLVAARESGVLKRWRATPLPRWCYFLGRILATALIPTTEAAAPTCVLTYFPFIIVSGVFGTINEPSWLAAIASYLPPDH